MAAPALELAGLPQKWPVLKSESNTLFQFPQACTNSWDADKPERIPTFTLLTREANPLLKQIHNAGENPGRMPLMLTDDMLEGWIKPEMTDAELKDYIDFSFPQERLEYWAVESVRKRHEDNESVLKRVEVEGLPPVE